MITPQERGLCRRLWLLQGSRWSTCTAFQPSENEPLWPTMTQAVHASLWLSGHPTHVRKYPHSGDIYHGLSLSCFSLSLSFFLLKRPLIACPVLEATPFAV